MVGRILTVLAANSVVQALYIITANLGQLETLSSIGDIAAKNQFVVAGTIRPLVHV